MDDVKSLQKRDSMVLNMRNYINSMESRISSVEDENFSLKNSVLANRAMSERVFITNKQGVETIAPEMSSTGGVQRKSDGNFLLSASIEGATTVELRCADGSKPMIFSMNVNCFHEKSPDMLFSINSEGDEEWKEIRAAEKLHVFYVPPQNKNEGWNLKISIKSKAKIIVDDYAFIAFSDLKAIWNNAESGTRIAQII